MRKLTDYRLIILIIFFLSASRSFAADVYSLKGKILSADNDAPLEMAIIKTYVKQDSQLYACRMTAY